MATFPYLVEMGWWRDDLSVSCLSTSMLMLSEGFVRLGLGQARARGLKSTVIAAHIYFYFMPGSKAALTLCLPYVR